MIPTMSEMLSLIKQLQKLPPGFQDLTANVLKFWAEQRQAAEKPRLN
jgi:hypothetical protein